MHFSLVTVILAAVAGHAFAAGYGGGSGAGGYSGGSGSGGSYGGSNLPPQPYSFEYEARDEQGNVHFRKEQGDQSGTVKGSYGYTDVNGLNRVVEYVADASGYRASIQSNEPGVGEDSPADVVLFAQAPPAGLQDRFNRGGGAPSYSGGAGSGFGGSFGSGAGGLAPKPIIKTPGKSGY